MGYKKKCYTIHESTMYVTKPRKYILMSSNINK